MIVGVELVSLIRNDLGLPLRRVTALFRRALMGGVCAEPISGYPGKFKGVAVTYAASTRTGGYRECFVALTEDGESIEGFIRRTPHSVVKLTPLLKLPGRIRAVYMDAVEAVVEVEMCRVVDLVRKLWETSLGIEYEDLVSVYTTLRMRGLQLPVEAIGELVGARYGSLRRAKEVIKGRKLFAVKPEPELAVRTLVELGVPETIARTAVACAENCWTIHRLAGCLHAHGLPLSDVTRILGVTAPTVKRHASKLSTSALRRGQY